MQTYDSIKTRLQQQAASRFGRSIEALPQEVRLFIDWMSAELGSLHREMSRSNDAIQQRITQRLTPDVQTRPRPAYLLLSAQPRKTSFTLDPEEHIFTLPRLAEETPNELFFAPLLPSTLVPGKVKYLLNNRGLIAKLGQGNQHYLEDTSARQASKHSGIVWMAVQWDGATFPGQELCFHVAWKVEHPARQAELYRRTPLISWIYDDKKLQSKIGISIDPQLQERSKSKFVDEEYLHNYRIEKEVLDVYNDQFVRVIIPGGLTTGLPQEVAEQLTGDTRSQLETEKLFWFKLLFPAGVQPSDLEHCSFDLNCFPALNRKLDRTRDFRPYGDNHVEILPLSNADRGRKSLPEVGAYFLGIQRIFSRDTDYRPITVQEFRHASPGSYALQRGRVEANDFRDLYARIAELTEQLRTHASTLTLLPQHQMGQALSSIEHGAETLATALKNIPPKDLDLGYYLHLKVLDPQDMIYIRFWITQGEYAQGVANPGDFLRVEKSGVVEGDVVWVK